MKKCSNTAVMVVVYPGLEPWLPDFVDSINLQTDKDFDIIIYRDGFEGRLGFLEQFNVVTLRSPDISCIAKNRQFCINTAKELGYEKLIFSDGDDFFQSNRIRLLKAALEHNDIAFNDLTTVNEEGAVLQERVLANGIISNSVSSICDILDYNVLGFSHTAINLRAIQSVSIPSDIIAVDWFLFSVILSTGASVSFVKEVETFYRQSDANTVGMQRELDKSSLQQALQVKLRHYQSMLSIEAVRQNTRLNTQFTERLNEMMLLREHLKSTFNLELYIKHINQNFNKVYKGWWSLVLPIQQWEKIDE